MFSDLGLLGSDMDCLLSGPCSEVISDVFMLFERWSSVLDYLLKSNKSPRCDVKTKGGSELMYKGSRGHYDSWREMRVLSLDFLQKM